ncbi:hypothetical protein LPJ61_004814 [Coemansia biformis]|uniref:Peptidase S54 rhomboid domain-containing protein n=1 Tax=Coemansia biformis TaxID=1286918 RepID=A0A9W7Y9Y5_9FUNG|nr:hypothetical protein LPJ61_004814 [Coemansia biformis]
MPAQRLGRGSDIGAFAGRGAAGRGFTAPFPRGQQGRGARWEQHTKADYGSRRGNAHRNGSQPNQWRLSPEGVVYAIIGVNGLVYLVWQTSITRATGLHDARMYTWMRDNFAVMWANVEAGRVWTLLTAAFSHSNLLHLAVNMFVLHSFGTDIARLVGVRRFMLFYLGAAVCGNMFSAVINGIVLPRITGDRSQAMRPSIGASTSAVGIATLFACLYPNASLLVFFVVPAPAWLVATGLVGWDIWRVLSMQQSSVDGAGHLGGAVAGLGYYWFRLRPHLRRLR